MEDESSVVNYVPPFARGLNVLLVNHDTLSLMYLSSLLQQYTFNVTATDKVSEAVSMICTHEDRFKLVMVKVNIPAIDAFSFLNLLHQKDIPVIFISSEGFDDVIGRELAKGSCYFLEEPILLNDFKCLWQHVYSSKPTSAMEAQNANKLMTTQCEAGGSYGERKEDDNESKEREKGGEVWSSPMKFESHYCIAKETEERREHKVGYARKKRVVWTPELHLKFTKAVALLGNKNARPKAILNLMNVPDLTSRQISSHMQCEKHWKNVLKITAELATGSPASTASINVSKKQDQLVMNYSENHESYFHKVQKALINPSFAHEFPTGLANNGSQNLGDTVGNPLPDASMDQTETAYDDIIEMLEKDCDTNNCFGNEINPDDVEQYSEMLRTILENS
ncbi:putative two-component response regulator-like APRR6 [Abrus precatorius]|uniref:Two-component response regulator-like APRR6 n=1 Tax=Abrus precatorius TaxID=3816 RepID=A0A8B8M1B7_ABRPR|nr:putative two-component response regulator-like APRR6 [Abrus precatorius]